MWALAGEIQKRLNVGIRLFEFGSFYVDVYQIEIKSENLKNTYFYL